MQDIVDLLRLNKGDGLRSIHMNKAADEIEKLRKIIIRALNDYDQSDYPDMMDFEWVADAHKAIYPEVSDDKR